VEGFQGAPSVFFSLEKGALVCKNCSGTWKDLLPLSVGTARLIERISQADLEKMQRLKFTSQALLESRVLLPRFIAYQLGKELRSLKALEGLGVMEQGGDPRASKAGRDVEVE